MSGTSDVEIASRYSHTRVHKVVGIIVVSDGTRLRSIELRVLDFFELDHDSLLDWSGWLLFGGGGGG